jgi:hypothetical protein
MFSSWVQVTQIWNHRAVPVGLDVTAPHEGAVKFALTHSKCIDYGNDIIQNIRAYFSHLNLGSVIILITLISSATLIRDIASSRHVRELPAGTRNNAAAPVLSRLFHYSYSSFELTGESTPGERTSDDPLAPVRIHKIIPWLISGCELSKMMTKAHNV